MIYLHVRHKSIRTPSVFRSFLFVLVLFFISSFLVLFLFSAMALGGGTPVDGLDGAVVRHVVVLERQQVGHDPALGVVWGEFFSLLLQTLH